MSKNSSEETAGKTPKRPFVSKFTKGDQWQPNKIVYESTDEELTAAGGISNLVDLFAQSSQYRGLRSWLPAGVFSMRQGI